MSALEDSERAELIALTELREAIENLATNRGNYWTRPGSRESSEQTGEQRAYNRVLQMIDGRTGNARKPGREPEGTAARTGRSEPLARGEDAEALVPSAEVVPAAGAR